MQKKIKRPKRIRAVQVIRDLKWTITNITEEDSSYKIEAEKDGVKFVKSISRVYAQELFMKHRRVDLKDKKKWFKNQ